MIRKIGKQGTVTLPKAIRVEAGLHPGMAVEVTAENGTVAMKAVHTCCSLCGSPEDVYGVAGINICKKCAKAVAEVIK